jgi:hypothetical protein
MGQIRGTEEDEEQISVSLFGPSLRSAGRYGRKDATEAGFEEAEQRRCEGKGRDKTRTFFFPGIVSPIHSQKPAPDRVRHIVDRVPSTSEMARVAN